MTPTQTDDTFDSLKLLGAGRSFQEELCNMISTTQMFRDLEWHDIEILSGYMQAYEASAGTTLFREDEKGSYMCLIVKGKVDICKKDNNDVKKIVSTISSGKTLGEMAIIDGERRSATAIVIEPTTLAILTETNFLRIVAEKPALATQILLKIARLLSQRLRQTSGKLVDYLDN